MLAWSLAGWGAGGSLDPCRRMHQCRLCGAQLTRTFVDLGMSPLCESYIPEESLDEAESFYPLHVRLCEACLLVQLPAYVSGEHIFSDYAYFSSYSDSWVAHAKRYAEAMIERLGLTPAASSPRWPATTAISCSTSRPRASRCSASSPPRTWPRRPGPGASGRRSSSWAPKPAARSRGTVRPGRPGGGEQRLRPRARHPGLRGRAARAGQGRGHGDAGIPAPAPPDRAPAVRHDLP